MTLNGINAGDVIQFVTRVDHSSENQSIQSVTLKVTELTTTHVRGVNSLRTLNSDGREKQYRSYRLDNIAEGTVWKLVG